MVHPLRLSLVLAAAAATSGCAGNIDALYQAEKDAVFGEPAPPGESWQPDVRLRVSRATLETLSGAAVDAGLLDLDREVGVDGPLGLRIEARPQAKVNRLRLQPGADCAACLSVTAQLSGTAAWTAGPLKGKLPFDADLGGVVTFQATQKAGRFAVTGKLKRVTSLKVSAGRIKKVSLNGVLKRWVNDAVTGAPPIQLGQFGGGKLPLSRARVSTAGGQLELQGLTSVVGRAPVSPASGGPLDAGWELRISESTIAGMIRKQAFEAGVLDLDIALDPRAIDFEGDRFTMDLRLWRLKGAGWWRDYTVDGSTRLVNGRVKLRSEDATEAGKSRGAGLADPIALLAEGRILTEVANGVREVFPAQATTRLQGLAIVAEADALTGDGDAVVVRGSAGVP